MKFVLPGWPPSINASHFARGRRLKPETRAWIESAGLMLLGQKRGQQPLTPGAKLALMFSLHGQWTTANGKERRVDLSNRIKILEDTIAKVCGFDDSQIVRILGLKIEAEHPSTHVVVEEWSTVRKLNSRDIE